MTKIVIHGAGSIGCFIGGTWASTGLDVTLIGRDYIHETINKNGMTLTDYSGFKVKLSSSDIAFSETPAAMNDADIIILAVKSTGTEAAAHEIAANAKADAIVVSL